MNNSEGRIANSQSEEVVSNEIQEVIQNLPKERGWRTPHMYLYNGFWYAPELFEGFFAAQQHFQAQDTDKILVTPLKSGTTWLKSLIYAIVNRNRYSPTDPNHPLQTANSHRLIPIIEFMYKDKKIPDLSSYPSPRLLSSHASYSMLPESVIRSDCRIIFLFRDPKDIFISLWFYMNKVAPDTIEKLSLEETFEFFCKGISPLGPCWDQAIEFWKMSLERPEKVLFLRYENLKENTTSQIKNIAKFLGFPVSLQEENEGVDEQIAQLCSFEHLRNLEASKTEGEVFQWFPLLQTKDFFRKGVVGDWANYLTPSMADRLDQIAQQKLQGTGFSVT